MNTAIAKKRINQVLRIDSIDSTDSDFLATHVPFRKIVVGTKSGNQFEETYRSEEYIYRDIFNHELPVQNARRIRRCSMGEFLSE